MIKVNFFNSLSKGLLITSFLLGLGLPQAWSQEKLDVHTEDFDTAITPKECYNALVASAKKIKGGLNKLRSFDKQPGSPISQSKRTLELAQVIASAYNSIKTGKPSKTINSLHLSVKNSIMTEITPKELSQYILDAVANGLICEKTPFSHQKIQPTVAVKERVLLGAIWKHRDDFPNAITNFLFPGGSTDHIKDTVKGKKAIALEVADNSRNPHPPAKIEQISFEELPIETTSSSGGNF